MSRIISKVHQGKVIPIAELSMKKNFNVKNPNQVVLVFKVLHGSTSGEEDVFIFYFNTLLNNWVLNLEKSLVSLNMMSNHRLLDEIYGHFKPSEVVTIEEFTDLLENKHFDIFVDGNTPNEPDEPSLKSWIKKLFCRQGK